MMDVEIGIAVEMPRKGHSQPALLVAIRIYPHHLCNHDEGENIVAVDDDDDDDLISY